MPKRAQMQTAFGAMRKNTPKSFRKKWNDEFIYIAYRCLLIMCKIFCDCVSCKTYTRNLTWIQSQSYDSRKVESNSQVCFALRFRFELQRDSVV